MTFQQWLAVGVLAWLPFAAAAQQTPQVHPFDPHATVPAPAYDSAFKSYRATGDEQASPDKAWRAANDEMAKLKGHAGHMKSEAQAAPVDHRNHH